MSKKIKIFFLILCLFAFMPQSFLKVNANTLTVEEIKEKYPDGSTWNDSYYFSRECAGFARLLFSEYYGYNPTLYADVSTDLNNIKPGDVLRYDGDGAYVGGHEVWVIGVNGNKLTVVECNWGGANLVTWGRIIDKNNITNVQHIYVAPYAIGETPVSLEPAKNIKVSLNNTQSALNITWDKVIGVTGYQIEIYKEIDVLENDFSNPEKIQTNTKSTSNSLSISQMEQGNYYVYVRTKRTNELSSRGNGVKFYISPITDITLNKTSLGMIVGQTEKITATVNPTDTNFNKSITWSSSDEDVATVDDEGNVTSHSLGYAIIYAESVNGITATCSIVVSYTEIPIEAIFLNKYSVTLAQNQQTTLSATYRPSDATGDKTITWESYDESIAIVDQYGNVTGVGEGSTYIAAKSINGMLSTSRITVTSEVVYPITSIYLSESNIELVNGESKTLVATICPENTTDNKTLYWSSSDTSVAKVNSTGTVTAVGKGTTTITVKSKNGKTATCEVVVNPISIDYAIVSSIADQEYTGFAIKPSVELKVNNDSLIENEDYKLTYSDNTQVGTATIVIEGIGNYSGMKSVNFEIYKKYLEISDTSKYLIKGNTITLEATLHGSNEEVTYNWESSNEGVATVDDTGNVIAKENGTTVIKVTTSNGYSATCTIEVGDIIKGDINQEGNINLTDVIIALRMSLGFDEATDQDKIVGDMNDDGELTLTDVILILRKSLGFDN